MSSEFATQRDQIQPPEQQTQRPRQQPQGERPGLTHEEDPDRPGWCAVCRRAYPCPPTLTRAEARRLAIRFRDAR